MPTTDCEVLVIGAGPAATFAATSLARQGKDVIQVVGPFAIHDRPYEVIAPSMRYFLGLHRVPEPTNACAACRGVLSMWNGSEADFHDYVFTGGTNGLAFERSAFHQALLRASQSAGVRVLDRAKVHPDQRLWQPWSKIEVFSPEKLTRVGARWIIDATGRQSRMRGPSSEQREYFDRLVALSTPFNSRDFSDCLVLEAAENGWWYIPPAIEGKTHLVFLTDADLLPKHRDERRTWLMQHYVKSTLVSSLAASTPVFAHMQGTDARFSRLVEVARGSWFAVGDRALALDPLSGTGTSLALHGARQLALELGTCDSAESNYREWYRQAFVDEQAKRSATYERAANRFPTSLFWQRRCANLAKIQAEYDGCVGV